MPHVEAGSVTAILLADGAWHPVERGSLTLGEFSVRREDSVLYDFRRHANSVVSSIQHAVYFRTTIDGQAAEVCVPLPAVLAYRSEPVAQEREVKPEVSLRSNTTVCLPNMPERARTPFRTRIVREAPRGAP